jgi:hypothetical protein
LDECRYVARELEVYGAEDEPRVNVHKHLFRLAAALIRRNADALQASEERGQRLRALCEEGLQRVRDLCENKAVNEMVKNAPWNAVYDLARAIRVAIEAALATPRGEEGSQTK